MVLSQDERCAHGRRHILHPAALPWGVELSETDARGRLTLIDKVAIAGIVGDEDGAHHIAAVLFQSLNDIGLTIPSQSSVYWNGEAMQTVDYKDLGEAPEKVASATATTARNAAHLARALREREYRQG